MKKKVILASKSPRRREILQNLGIDFEVCVADVDETVDKDTSPTQAVKEISLRKASAVAEKFSDDFLIISADTVVSIDGKIIGKPKDEKEAYEILSSLSAREHTVYTGFTISDGPNTVSDVESTLVKFRELTHDEIMKYIATGEPMDKAGAYGIQQKGNLFVEYIHGDYFNVMGLPISKICVTAEEFFGINLVY